MDAGSGISTTAGMITMDVVDSAVTLDVEATEERVFAGNAAGVAILMNAASEAASVVSMAANLTVEVSAARPASEVANRTVEAVFVAVAAHEEEALVAVHEVEATEAVAPTAAADRTVAGTGKRCLN
jgi:hypothetical protein